MNMTIEEFRLLLEQTEALDKEVRMEAKRKLGEIHRNQEEWDRLNGGMIRRYELQHHRERKKI